MKKFLFLSLLIFALSFANLGLHFNNVKKAYGATLINEKTDLTTTDQNSYLNSKSINVFEKASKGIDPHENVVVDETGLEKHLNEEDILIEKMLKEGNEIPKISSLYDISKPYMIQKIMVIIYDVHKQFPEYPYNDPIELTNDLAESLSASSIERGYENNGNLPNVNFKIVETHINNYHSPLKPGQTGGGAADYLAIMNEYNICEKSNNGQVDEVWLWADRSGGYWEATMIGNPSMIFNTNSQPIPLPECNKAVHVMGFNYERKVNLAMHSFGHRVENTLAFYWDGKFRSTAKPGDTYYSFDGQNGYSGHWDNNTWVNDPPLMLGYIGNIHFPPNTTTEYLYRDTNIIDSLINGWTPQHAILKQSTSCNTWQCLEKFYDIKYFQNIPGRCLSKDMTKVDGQPMPDMWYAIVKNGYVFHNTDCPNPLPSPSGFKIIFNPNTNTATLSWNLQRGALKYQIERCVGENCTNFEQIATTTELSYSSRIPVGQIYRYRISAYNGVPGEYSPIINSSATWNVTARAMCENGATPNQRVKLVYASWPPNPLVWNTIDNNSFQINLAINSNDSTSESYIRMTSIDGAITLKPYGVPPNQGITYGEYFNPSSWMAKLTRRPDVNSQLPSGNYQLPYLAPSTWCQPRELKAFITSTTYTGDLGGINGANSKCQLRAQEAGLNGTYKAWLSNNSFNAQVILPEAKYSLINGLVIADNKTELLSGNLKKPISITEFGTSSNHITAYTGTLQNGTKGINNCAEWTSSNSAISGLIGNPTLYNYQWTNNSNDSCSIARPIYCFQVE